MQINTNLDTKIGNCKSNPPPPSLLVLSELPAFLAQPDLLSFARCIRGRWMRGGGVDEVGGEVDWRR